MLSNYLKIAIRNILRYKSFSTINIVGLTIGLVAFLGISLYIADEFSFDQFHENKSRIHRAILTTNFNGQTTCMGAVPNLVGPTAMKEIPEVEKASRYFHHNFGDIAFVSTDTENFSENSLYFADPELFDIFTIPIVKGNHQKILDRPGTVVISERAAEKYFHGADPIGQVLKVNGKTELEVTGVYQNFPPNSFLQAELIGSFASNWFGLPKNQSWSNASFDTFFLLHKDVSKESADEKITAMLERNIAKEDRWYSIALQPLLDIRLYSGYLDSNYDHRTYGDINQVKILMGLAFIILLIAAVNYMNLTTAQSQRRNKEVGISKTLGATFGQLNRKFYLESGLFVLLSMVLSVVLFSLLLTAFNGISGKQISSHYLVSPWFWLGFIGVWALLTFLSGFYPAMYLSSFSPKSVLQKTKSTSGQGTLRKGLVVFQFAVSIILIICATIFVKQMDFIRNMKLGFQPGQVIAVMTTGAKDKDQIRSLKTSYESLGGVSKVARSQSFPGMGTSTRVLIRDGQDTQGVAMLTTQATPEIVQVLDIKLLAGTSLPANKADDDTTVQVVINKSAADYLGFTPEEAVGRKIEIQGFDGLSEVAGVTEDFNYVSLHEKVNPFCFHNAKTEGYTYLLVKVSTKDLAGSVNQLEKTFKQHIDASFEYTFLDEQLDKLYRAEQNLSHIVMLFAGLAIFVACLGLYALAAFTAEQRTKEIGIRKVMGASVPHLIGMLSKDFVVLVVIAFVIGIPVGYYIMNQWLQSFAYQTELTVGVFALAGIVSVLIACITVSYQSFKAANAKPVDSLRAE
jgi:putative ABC transport system permease protein